MNKLHVRRNDTVEVITGESKGVRGEVLRAMPEEGRVLVEGVNVVWKHVRPDRENPQGGRLQREAPIDASNVMLLCQNRECERHDKAVRTRKKVEPDGSKDRVCVKCGHPISTEQ